MPMSASLAWMIGGDQGEGIDSTGDVVATVANRLGYYVYGYKSFSSRIKGGYTYYKVRMSDQPVYAPVHGTHVLVALNQETITRDGGTVQAEGVILADEAFQPAVPEGVRARVVPVPLTAVARELGNVLVRNMVAAGASAALLNLPLVAFQEYAREKFERKGATVVEQNLTALARGYDAARQVFPEGLPFHVAPVPASRPRLLLTGNEAIALGAVAAGCRVMAAYPITPASDVMENLVTLFPQVGGAVCQMEDEIAAITLAIGAGYAGARAMTATAGPGLSLMQEGLGLASAAEIPVVLVDCQRSGPSTGMPTKEEQSDLFALVFGGHGEGQRIVLAPGTAEEAFRDTAEAFNLADRYQCPVIVASDLSLSQWKETVEDLPLDAVTIDRGAMADRQAVASFAGAFPRYAITESGISPRVVPGEPGGQYLATGVEHLPTGKVSEDPANRAAMMAKRARKIEPLRHQPGSVYQGPENPELLVVSFGSTVGAVTEAVAAIGRLGQRVGHLRVRRLWPLPVDELRPRVQAAEKVLFVEMNSTSQLRSLFRLEGILPERADSLLKYDGLLLTAEEVAEKIRAMFLEEVAKR
jgi:2-oxoglutarate ferredoxin oxidoreductase subunit alpha